MSRNPMKAVQKRQTLWREIWAKKQYYLYLAPTMTLLFVFLYYPVLSAVFHSFTNWDGYQAAKFVGLANYQAMLRDPNMPVAIKNMLFFSFGHLGFDLVMGVGVALLIFELGQRRSSRIFQTLFVVPLMIPFIITIFLWRFIYDPQFGLGNMLFTALGFKPQMFLGDPKLAMFWLVVLGFPKIWGPGVLMQLAALQGIPDSIHDSSQLDGVSWAQRVWSIDLPLILPQVRVLAVLSLINSLQAFIFQVTLTSGGPRNATTVPGYLLYTNGMNYNKMGYACAIGMVILVIILLTSYGIQNIGKKYTESY